MAKQAPLKRLSQGFLFQLNHSKKEKHHLKVIALFGGKAIEDFSFQFQKIQLPTSFKKHIEIAMTFSAKEGEMLFLPEEKLLIGGMGEFNDWHPEKESSLFRKVLVIRGACLKPIESVQFTLNAELKRSLLEHQMS